MAGIGHRGFMGRSMSKYYLYGKAIWSVRRVHPDYIGPCMRVRRSLDDSELDIYFIGEDLDTSSLTSFVGAGDGFVTIWYDQSGNNSNLSQINYTYQPRIVIDGVLKTDGTAKNTPAINFNSQYLNGGNILGFSQNCFFSTMAQTYQTRQCMFAKMHTGLTIDLRKGGYFVYTQLGPSGNPRRFVLYNSESIEYASDTRGHSSSYLSFFFEAAYNNPINVYRNNVIGDGVKRDLLGTGYMSDLNFSVGAMVNVSGVPSNSEYRAEINIQEINAFTDQPASRDQIYDLQSSYFF